MARLRGFVHDLHPYLLSSIAGTLTIAQIVLAFILRNLPGTEALRTAGVALWWIGAVFGWLPIFTPRRKGGVTRGKSIIIRRNWSKAASTPSSGTRRWALPGC